MNTNVDVDILLDKTLRVFLKHSPNKLTAKGAKDLLINDGVEIDLISVDALLDLLIDNKYLKKGERGFMYSEIMPRAKRIEEYSITFNGIIFYNNVNGGFVRSRNMEIYNSKRIIKVEKQTQILTGIVALGSLGVLIFEIFKYYFPEPKEGLEWINKVFF